MVAMIDRLEQGVKVCRRPVGLGIGDQYQRGRRSIEASHHGPRAALVTLHFDHKMVGRSSARPDQIGKRARHRFGPFRVFARDHDNVDRSAGNWFAFKMRIERVERVVIGR